MKYSHSALLGLAALVNAQGYAPAPPPPPPVCPTVVPTAVVYPLYISTYIEANTVFNINGNANITINNAPTNLQTTVTATSTVFSTVTTTVSGATAPTATTVNQPIILAINAPGVKQRRQNSYTGFLGPGGSIVATCGAATPLNLINGQLFTTAGGQFSTNTGIQSAPFAPSASVGSITTLFGSNGNFVWLNQAFSNGAASFCMAPNNQAIAVFTTAPAGCVPITFKPILASTCPSGVSASGSATSSVAASSSASVSSSSASSSASPPVGLPVQLTFPAPAGSTKEKRQGSTQYVTAQGTFSSNPSQAATFQLVGNQLYLGSTPFSTNPSTQYQIFSPINPVGSITTSFTSGTSFNWYNPAFTIDMQNNAEFAVYGNSLYVGFQSTPPGSTTVTLTASPPGTVPSNSTMGKRFNAYKLPANHPQHV